MKHKPMIVVLALSSLLLTLCTGGRTEPTSSITPQIPTQAPPPNTTPFPTSIPGVTPSPTVSPEPVPPVSVIASTRTVASDIAPGWTRFTNVNDVYDLAFAPDGTLWAMTSGGLVHWDLNTDTYVRYLVQARDIAVAPDGTLWLATVYGLCHFTAPDDNADDGATCVNYTRADGLIHNDVRAVAVTDDNLVWAGTQTGVSRFDGSVWQSYPAPVPTVDLAVAPNGEVWHATAAGIGRYLPSQDAWMTFTEEHGLPNLNAQIIAIGPDGEVWAYMLWQGVYRFDGEQWQALGEIPDGIVADIAFAADGTPWVSTDSMHYPVGSLFQRQGDAWTNVTQPQGLMFNRAVAVGLGGVVATGTNLGLGIYEDGEWRLLKDGPTRDRVTSVVVTPDGAVWFAFGDSSTSTPGGGLSRFDGLEWEYYLEDAEVNALAVAPDGSLWVGTGEAVKRFDGRSWKVLIECEGYPPCGAFDIAFTPDGAAWFANGFSLTRITDPGAAIEAHTSAGDTGDGQPWTRYEKLINSVVAAPDNAVWMNGWEGLQDSGFVARFDGENWKIYKTADSFPGGFRVGAVTDDGRVWGVTREGQLASFDGRLGPDDAPWMFYYPPDGFTLGSIVTIAPDGGLWLASDNGVLRFDPSVGLTSAEPGAVVDGWTAFSKKDNPIHDYAAIAFGPDDEIWFGATRFRPTQVLPAEPSPTATSSQATTQATATPSPVLSSQAIDVSWDNDPNARIIRYYSPYTTAGLAGAYDRNYYIPEAQVWGDGRIIWLLREGARRRVLEGRLTLGQMRALLERIVEAGFFGWEDTYYTLGGNSHPSMHLSVSLTGRSKEVSEHGGAPDAFYELRQVLTSGAGSVGSDFVPARGYLAAVPELIEADVPLWPDASTGITLDQVGEGRYIDDEALAFTWQAVNKNPRAPVYVKSNGQVYTIMVQIPGLSYFEPPP